MTIYQDQSNLIINFKYIKLRLKLGGNRQSGEKRLVFNVTKRSQ